MSFITDFWTSLKRVPVKMIWNIYFIVNLELFYLKWLQKTQKKEFLSRMPSVNSTKFFQSSEIILIQIIRLILELN